METKTSKDEFDPERPEKDNNKIIFSVFSIQEIIFFGCVFGIILLIVVWLLYLEKEMAAAIITTGCITGCFGVFTWYLTKKNERIWQEYHAKEEKYKKLISAIEGFYENTKDPALIQKFIDQTNLCWLYCPDEVIKNKNTFLDSVKEGVPTTSEQKERALGEFMLSLRKDLFSRQILKETELSGSDFKTYRPNKATQPT